MTTAGHRWLGDSDERTCSVRKRPFVLRGLRNTAAEVVREVGCYGGAYVHYLLSVYLPGLSVYLPGLSVYLPGALARDPTFGLALPVLGTAIRERLDRDDDPDAGLPRRTVDQPT